MYASVGDTVWPVTGRRLDEAEDMLRTGRQDREAQLYAASVVAAYRELLQLPRAEACKTLDRLRTARRYTHQGDAWRYIDNTPGGASIVREGRACDDS